MVSVIIGVRRGAGVKCFAHGTAVASQLWHALGDEPLAGLCGWQGPRELRAVQFAAEVPL